MNYSIHFHAWNAEEFNGFLTYAASRIPFRIELYVPFEEEMVAVLRKI